LYAGLMYGFTEEIQKGIKIDFEKGLDPPTP